MTDGNINTQPIKLDTGSYILTSFLIYNNNSTPTDTTDDILLRAAPLVGSDYYDLIENRLNLNINIESFKKSQYTVDVLCFDSLFYNEFGFTWFNINEIDIHSICVFGDVCTIDTSLYSGSLYSLQENGLQMDMPAISKILLYKNNILQSEFSNEDWLGEGNCLKIHWADDKNLNENFNLVIKTLLPVGNSFDYVTTDSIDFTDSGDELILDNNVLIYEVGNCSSDTLYSYGCLSWVNLPIESFDFSIVSVGNTFTGVPSTMGTYFDYNFNGIPSGYAVHDGVWSGWCGDKYHYITPGNIYDATFISSVQPLPSNFYLSTDQVNQLNWIFNNLDNYFPSIDVTNWLQYGNGFDNDDWVQIQSAIWGVTNNLDLSSPDLSVANQIYTESQNHTDFIPLSDEYGIVFIFIDNTIQLQLILLYC
jgi:hypothetical protein